MKHIYISGKHAPLELVWGQASGASLSHYLWACSADPCHLSAGVAAFSTMAIDSHI